MVPTRKIIASLGHVATGSHFSHVRYWRSEAVPGPLDLSGRVLSSNRFLSMCASGSVISIFFGGEETAFAGQWEVTDTKLSRKTALMHGYTINHFEMYGSVIMDGPSFVEVDQVRCE